MRIIIDNGAHTLRNMGDVAMLQVAIGRILEFCPGASLFVLTSRPDLLSRYCPGVSPLPARSRDAAYLTPVAIDGWRKIWRGLRVRKGPQPCAREFQSVFGEARAVVLAGGGFLNDGNPQQTKATLRMLADAAGGGKAVALFGQGLGPMRNPELVELLREVCRAGAPIGLRESCYGPELVRRTGGVPARVVVTGDDAVEMAWDSARTPDERIHDGLGISLRRVDYSGIVLNHLEQLAAAVQTLRTRLKAPLVPLPVSFNAFEDDPSAIEAVTGSAMNRDGLDDPLTLIRSAGRCRMVLAGTYHAAVFALSQGVPCLAFHASDYYRAKMEGLAAQFPGGCELADLSLDDGPSNLVALGEKLWNDAPALRAPLLRAAEQQVLAGKAFYRQALSGWETKPPGSLYSIKS